MEVVGIDRSHLRRKVQLKLVSPPSTSLITNITINKKKKSDVQKENRKTVKRINSAAKDMLFELNEIEKNADDSLSMMMNHLVMNDHYDSD
jgi:formiminotetrahydrofolate cyclodeaminase